MHGTTTIIAFPSVRAAPEPIEVPSAWLDALAPIEVQDIARAMRLGILDCPELRAAAIDLPALVERHGIERAAQRTGLPAAFVRAWSEGWSKAA